MGSTCLMDEIQSLAFDTYLYIYIYMRLQRQLLCGWSDGYCARQLFIRGGNNHVVVVRRSSVSPGRKWGAVTLWTRGRPHAPVSLLLYICIWHTHRKGCPAWRKNIDQGSHLDVRLNENNKVVFNYGFIYTIFIYMLQNPLRNFVEIGSQVKNQTSLIIYYHWKKGAEFINKYKYPLR